MTSDTACAVGVMRAVSAPRLHCHNVTRHRSSWSTVLSDLAQGLLSFVQDMHLNSRLSLRNSVWLSNNWGSHPCSTWLMVFFPSLLFSWHCPVFRWQTNLLWFRIQREQTRPWTSLIGFFVDYIGYYGCGGAGTDLSFTKRVVRVPLPQLQPDFSALPLVQSGSVAQSFRQLAKVSLDDARKKQASREGWCWRARRRSCIRCGASFLTMLVRALCGTILRFLTVPQEASFREMFHEKLLAFAPSTLRGAISTWKRWLKWAARSEVDEPPLAIHVALFLREEARGPTGGRGLWTSLRFLEINLGFVLHCCSPLVSPWKHPESHHVPVQRFAING